MLTTHRCGYHVMSGVLIDTRGPHAASLRLFVDNHADLDNPRQPGCILVIIPTSPTSNLRGVHCRKRCSSILLYTGGSRWLYADGGLPKPLIA